MVGMQPKVTYYIWLYSRIYKEQDGQRWNTSFISLTRQEVQDFHNQRRKWEFVIAWDTVENLLQDEVFDSFNMNRG